MTDQEWEDFLKELESCGFEDTVKAFKTEDLEVTRLLEKSKTKALEWIGLANTIQTYEEAEKEGRIIFSSTIH